MLSNLLIVMAREKWFYVLLTKGCIVPKVAFDIVFENIFA